MFSKSGTQGLESAFKHAIGLFKGKMSPFALWFSDSSALLVKLKQQRTEKKRNELIINGFRRHHTDLRKEGLCQIKRARRSLNAV